MTRKRIIRDGTAPARRSTTVPTDSPPEIDLMVELRKSLTPSPATPPEPRLRTLSDEVTELRGALIAMLWDVVGRDEGDCDGRCEAPGLGNPGAQPRSDCAAVRALGWAEHFDARSFEQRASR